MQLRINKSSESRNCVLHAFLPPVVSSIQVLLLNAAVDFRNMVGIRHIVAAPVGCIQCDVS
jgi:threonine/homoserine efflux transporter RhtA